MIEFLVVLALGWIAWKVLKICLGAAWLTIRVLVLLTLGAAALVRLVGHG